jgi:hypothetical protein
MRSSDRWHCVHCFKKWYSTHCIGYWVITSGLEYCFLGWYGSPLALGCYLGWYGSPPLTMGIAFWGGIGHLWPWVLLSGMIWVTSDLGYCFLGWYGSPLWPWALIWVTSGLWYCFRDMAQPAWANLWSLGRRRITLQEWHTVNFYAFCHCFDGWTEWLSWIYSACQLLGPGFESQVGPIPDLMERA